MIQIFKVFKGMGQTQGNRGKGGSRNMGAGYTLTPSRAKCEKVWGYTLIEVLVYFAIFAAVSVFAITALITMTENFARLEASQSALQSGRSGMDRLVFEIRRAKSAMIEPDTPTSGVDRIELTRGGASGDLENVFFVDGGALLLETADGSTASLTRDGTRINTLELEKISVKHARAIKIELGVSASSTGQTSEQSFRDTIILRNHDAS